MNPNDLVILGVGSATGALGALAALFTTYGQYVGYIAFLAGVLGAVFHERLTDIIGPIVWKVVAVSLLLGAGSIWLSLGGTAVAGQ